MTVISMQHWTVLTFITAFKKRSVLAPRLREIREGCGLQSIREVKCVLYEMQMLGVARSFNDRGVAMCCGPVAVRP
jgi:hypothetical protein